MRFPTAILFQEDQYLTFLEPFQEVLFGFQGAVASLCRLRPGYNCEGFSATHVAYQPIPCRGLWRLDAASASRQSRRWRRAKPLGDISKISESTTQYRNKSVLLMKGSNHYEKQ
jgi:hypothetical protein